MDTLPPGMESADIPADWMRKELERIMSAEDMAKIQSLGGLDKVLEEFKKRLEEQSKRHQGGNKMIGTGGTSAFGANGYNPEGIRIEQGRSRHKSAIKVWEQRNYKDLDDNIQLGIRNIKVALRRLRKFARQGAAEEFDLDGTIKHTARNAGFLDIRWCQSAITPLKYSCSLILVAQWTLTFVSVKSYSRPPKQNSNTWKLFTSITVFMNLFGRAIFAALISAQKPGKYYENMGQTIKSSLSVMP